MPCRTAVVLLCVALVSQASCGGGGETPVTPPVVKPTTGSVVVVVTERGNGRDADGFHLRMEGASARLVAYDTPVRYDSLQPGGHTFRIDSVATHCRVADEARVLNVKAGVTDTVQVDVTCIGGLAYHQFVSNTQFDIAYLTPDGRTIQLATGPEKKFIIEWSPDGSRMVYEKQEGNDFHDYTVKADGTDTRRLPGSGQADWPRWSRDGTRLAFGEVDSAIGSGQWIVTTDPDGGNRRIVTDTASFDFNPDWSPDGSRLYFGCIRYGRYGDLCTTAADGSGLHAIRYALIDSIEAIRPKCTASACVYVINPNNFQIAPDGRHILFDYYPYNAPRSTWVGAVDGSHVVPLSGKDISFSGHWSPTGERVLLNIWDGNTSYALATAKPDGSDYHHVTSFFDQDESGEISPDGALIAFDGFRSGTQQLWVMNVDGSGGRQITYGYPSGFAPRWNPKAGATGTLTGGQASTATSLQPRSPSYTRASGQTGGAGRSNVCRAIRDGAAVRFSCPGTR